MMVEYTCDVVRINDAFERLRKSRTTVNVRGAAANRTFFHLLDGPVQARRDEVPANLDWETLALEMGRY